MAVGLSAAALAAALRGTVVPWPAFAVAIALQIALLGRTAYLTIRRLRASSGTTTSRTIGYLELTGWIAVALGFTTVVALDASETRWSGVLALWLVFEWLYAATPRGARLEEIERRLMRRSDVIRAALARDERERTATAERLLRFYDRAPAGEESGVIDQKPHLGAHGGA